jgi:eukaryotic-like serine/threonine-protein kinase
VSTADTEASSPCLADDDVAAILEGRAAPSRLAAAHDHAATCDACRELLAAAGRVRAHERTDHDGLTTVLDAPPPRPEPEPAEGDTIGRFRVLSRLGEGGMGLVLAAFDEQLQRRVAIKLLRRTGSSAASGHARLLREARAMARVDHPNVVAIHEVGEHDGRVFIVMDLFDGSDLRTWLRQRPRTWQAIVDAWIEAGKGLAAVHAYGLVHRDFKPHNVLVHADGRVQVTDFGLVGEAADRDDSVDEEGLRAVLGQERTQAGAVLGTPRYMAPEQLDGRTVTAAADQFAFCVSLWEALTEHHPFGDDRVLLRDLLVEPPRDATKAPARVLAALRRGLAFVPEDRHPGMAELLRTLTHARELPARRRRTALAAVGVGLAVGVGSLLGSLERSPSLCAEPEGGDFAGQWDTARRDRVLERRRALDGPDVADRLARHLDEHAARWSALRKDACEDTRVRGEVSLELLDRRMACLDARRAAFATTIDLLDDAAIDDPLTLVYGLPPLSPCRDLEGLSAEAARPRDPATAARIQALETELAAADVLWSAGRTSEAQQRLAPIVSEAEAIGWAPLHARALAHASRIERGDDPLAGLRTWRRAFVAATRAGAAAGYEVALEGVNAHVRTNELEQAELFADVAAAQVEALGHEPYPGDLANNRALLAARRDDLPGAERHLRAAIAAVEDDPERRTALMHFHLNLVAVVAAQDRLDEAREAGARAVGLAIELFGEAHPSTLQAEVNAANVELAVGRLEQAASTAERVVARWRAHERPLEEAVALDLHARALHLLERPRECITPAERALALRRAALLPEDPLVPRTLGILARCQLDAGLAADALRSLDEALVHPGASAELVAELEPVRTLAREPTAPRPVPAPSRSP